MYLFFDTETTNLYNLKAPHDDPSQPHIVQLAACLTDAMGNVMGSMNMIIASPVPSEPKALEAHGITDEIVKRFGMPLTEALNTFWMLQEKAETLIGHNVSFDRKMLRTAFHRAGLHNFLAEFEKRRTFCTMQASTPLCKLPGSRGYKWPKLVEAYRHFFDEELEGAHDAMIDVMACKDVFFALRALKAA